MSQVELPTESSGRSWTLCDHAGCTGEAAQNSKCFLHLDDGQRAAYLAAVAKGQTRLTLAGLTISGPELAAVFAAMPQPGDNPSGSPRPLIPSQASFDETTFTDYIDAQHVTFEGHCSMAKAIFERGAIWNGSRFLSGLDLRRATLRARAKFSNLRVIGNLSCQGLRADCFFVLVGLDVTGDLDLRWAETDGVWLSNGRIAGDALLREANFASGEADDTPHQPARFDGMSVDGTADFSKATFPYETTVGGYAEAPPTVLRGRVLLDDCVFGTPTTGGRTLLQGLELKALSLSGCRFYGRVSFAGCRSESALVITDLKVAQPTKPAQPDSGDALFPTTTLDLTDLSLERGGRLSDITVEGSIELHCARLEGELEMSGMRASEIEIRGTVFGYAPLEIAAGQRLAFVRCLFQRGGILSCTGDVSFSECDARQPLIVASADKTASLTALARSNVEHFLLRNLDLSRTAFADASNLDKLRIQGNPSFLRAPTRIARGRQIILDEALTRATDDKRWRSLLQPSENPSPAADAQTVSATYRALRKNREDSRDEPGGSDFYYGEMEMRRRAASRWSAEKWLLLGYWAVSGYTLRAWRALTTLLAVLAVGGVLLDRYGYQRVSSGGVFDASLLLAKVALALTRTPEGLNSGGTIITIATRLLCPALLALAILALRNRVKR
jgi:hypothetical protein